MAFFDNLSKKLTEVSQNAVQKTKELAEVTKLNASIAETERKAEGLYIQIGKLFVEKHADECGEDFGELVAALQEAEKTIAELRQQVQNIKGVVRCEKCGAEIPAGVAFCSACGAPAPKPVEPEVAEEGVKCPACGAAVAEGMKFCTSCGAPLPQAEAPAEEAPSEEQPS